jgi:putative transcriptional regulator
VSKKMQRQVQSKFKTARLSLDLSQQAVADKAGIDRKTINRIENGHFSPNLDTFFRVCKVLKLKPQDVVKA